MTARFCGGRVAIDGETSETTQSWANADGSITSDVATAPVRVRKSDGSWTPVDLALQKDADGSIVAAAHPNDLRISAAQAGAGEHVLAAVGIGADRVAMSFAGVLPEPTLEGNRATYANVRPGVDLVVEATRTGFEQLLVLKDRAAAAQVSTISLPVTGVAITSHKRDAGGSLSLLDKAGKTVVTVPVPTMWDSQVDERGQRLRETVVSSTVSKRTAVKGFAKPTGRGMSADARLKGAAGVTVALTPAAAWLADPATRYPVTIDPVVNPFATNMDTYVKEGSSSDYSGATDLQIGWTGTQRVRSILSFGTPWGGGVYVQSATLNLWNWWSPSCTLQSWEIWRVGQYANLTGTVTWANMPAWTGPLSTPSTATRGFSSSCDDGWVTIDAKKFFQDASNEWDSNPYMGIRATNEASTAAWKQFRSRNTPTTSQVPFVNITYWPLSTVDLMSVPAPGGDRVCFNLPPSPISAGDLNSLTPTLKAQISNSAGGSMYGRFQVQETDTGTVVVSNAVGSTVTSGGTSSYTIPAGKLVEGRSYEWYAAGDDGHTWSGDGTAPQSWSMHCQFRVDITAPTLPTVTSASYPGGEWSGGAGTPGQFILDRGTNSDVQMFEYSFDGAPVEIINPMGSGSTATVNWTPTSDGPHSLVVWSVDNAENRSKPTSFQFFVGKGGFVTPTTGMTSAGKMVIAPIGAPQVTRMELLQWRRGDANTWQPVPVSDLTYTDGGATLSAWPLLSTGSGAFASLNWDVAKTLNDAEAGADPIDGPLQVRGLFSNGTGGSTQSGVNGWWRMRENAGTVAVDSSGSQNNATLAGGVTWSTNTADPYATFNATTGIMKTGGPVLNTSQSYTVSAWAKLNSTASFYTIASQGGVNIAAFDLQYNKGLNAWIFLTRTSDASAATMVYARASTVPAVGVWTHLVGVSDNGVLTIYVNGTAVGTATNPTPWNSTGPLTIGAGTTTAAGTINWFNGSISNVQTYQRALSGSEVTSLYGSGRAPMWTGGSSPVKVTYDKAMGQADTVDMGPGSVNLLTGNMSIGGSDFAAGGLGVGRTYDTRLATKADGTGMYGPGWVSGFADFPKLTATNGMAEVATPTGIPRRFTLRTLSGGDEVYTEPTPGSTTSLTYTPSTDVWKLTQRTTSTTFARRAIPGSVYVADKKTVESGEATKHSWEDVTVDGQTVTRPTSIITSPAGMTCVIGSLVRGCRAVQFSYSTTTTASGTAEAAWGDYAGRLASVTFTAYDPVDAMMKTVTTARYAYDNTGKLRMSWDERLDHDLGQHLGVRYNYDGDGILNQITPPGQEPWNLNFTTIPGDTGKGRIANVTRSALSAGTAVSTLVYNVPVSGSGAPYDLSAGQTARWAQTAAPVSATALFPATQIPDGNQAAGTKPSSYERATVSYLDASGRGVNTAEPGGGISATWFDQYGNTVRELTAGNRKRALDFSSTDDATSEANEAKARSTKTGYSADGSRVTTTYEPQHSIQLVNGTIISGRARTSYTYDEGAPGTGGPFNLVTTEVQDVSYWVGGVENFADARTTKTEYDWTELAPTKEITDPAGLALATRQTYDSLGRIVSQTTPGGGSSDTTPSTRVTVYYSNAANSTYPACGGHVEWEGQVCLTKPGGQAGSGPELTSTRITYNIYGEPWQRFESTSAGTLRTSTIAYDAAGRAVDASVDAPGLGEALETRHIVYDPATGQNTRTQTRSGSTVTGEIIRTFDTLGQQTSYTDADSANSTVSFDILGRPAVTVDGRGSRTYTYDGGTERRGLPTSVVDTHAGTFTGSYDTDGNLVAQTWGNGMTVAVTTNEIGEPTTLLYAQPGCGQADCTLYTESVKSSIHGQSLQRTSTLSSQDYAYDMAGRLTQVKDTIAGACTTRAYTFDTSTNRTGLTTYAPGTGGACQTATPSTPTTWTFDSADRVTGGGYTYDALGRTLTMPGVDTAVLGGELETLGYYTNDMARTISQGNRTNTYTLDVVGNRFRSWTETTGSTTVEKKHHYADDSDNPNWTDEGGGNTSWTFAGLGGTTGIYTSGNGDVWQIGNLHGDFVAGIQGSAIGLSYTSEYTEVGRPRAQSDAGTRRYGWLGQESRAADTPGGMILMGSRLYGPGSGRFLSRDSVFGGNANPYEYCAGDSVGCSDISGNIRDGKQDAGRACIQLTAFTTQWEWLGKTKKANFKCYFSDKLVLRGLDGYDYFAAIIGAFGASPCSWACVVIGLALYGSSKILSGMYRDECDSRGIWIKMSVRFLYGSKRFFIRPYKWGCQ